MKGSLPFEFIVDNQDVSQRVRLRELTGYVEQFLIDTKDFPPFLRSIHLLELVDTIDKRVLDTINKIKIESMKENVRNKGIKGLEGVQQSLQE